MTTEELNTQLYEKMFAEQEKYRQWLLTQPPDEILNHAYEYTIRNDILLSLEYNDLNGKQAQALLKSPCPLDDVFKAWENRKPAICGIFSTPWRPEPMPFCARSSKRPIAKQGRCEHGICHPGGDTAGERNGLADLPAEL